MNWRDHSPSLAGWLDDFAAVVPGYQTVYHPKLGLKAVDQDFIFGGKGLIMRCKQALGLILR